LVDKSVYATLAEKNILYCPDFAINSGGVICVSAELASGGPQNSWIESKVGEIYGTIARVLDEAMKRGLYTEEVAIELAKERLAEAKRRGRR
jgi:leucine dehydrogenase